MNRLIIYIVCFVVNGKLAAQSDLSFISIVQRYDTLAGHRSALCSRALECQDSLRRGLRIEPLFTATRNGRLIYRGIQCEMKGFAEGSRRSKLVVVFYRGPRLVLYSLENFNCHGNAYFDADGAMLEDLARPVRMIRFISGRSYRSYTYRVPPADAGYFIAVREALLRQRSQLAVADR